MEITHKFSIPKLNFWGDSSKNEATTRNAKVE